MKPQRYVEELDDALVRSAVAIALTLHLNQLDPEVYFQRVRDNIEKFKEEDLVSLVLGFVEEIEKKGNVT